MSTLQEMYKSKNVKRVLKMDMILIDYMYDVKNPRDKKIYAVVKKVIVVKSKVFNCDYVKIMCFNNRIFHAPPGLKIYVKKK